MGQSFLPHDEKSDSPSPDLLQFNRNRKFFGSSSSVKETNSSKYSAGNSDRDFNETSASSSASSTSARSPSDLYSDLIPTPISPGNVNRLKEKFMKKRSFPTSSQRDLALNDFVHVDRAATTSPFIRRSHGGIVTRRSVSRRVVLQPKAVIIRAGYLPVVKTVDVVPTKREVVTKIKVQNVRKQEEILVSSHPRSSLKQVVTKNEDHTVNKVLMKDAEVNTSAEVIVLPKGVKAKTIKGEDKVDGKKTKRRRKKKGLRRIGRAFGWISIRFLEFF